MSAVIETEIGKIAQPKKVWIVPDMPKTAVLKPRLITPGVAT